MQVGITRLAWEMASSLLFLDTFRLTFGATPVARILSVRFS